MAGGRGELQKNMTGVSAKKEKNVWGCVREKNKMCGGRPGFFPVRPPEDSKWNSPNGVMACPHPYMISPWGWFLNSLQYYRKNVLFPDLDSRWIHNNEELVKTNLALKV